MFSKFLSERSSQRWIPKPQFWYPPLRLGSQHRIPKPLFLVFFWVCTAVLGFVAQGQIFLRRPSPKLESQDQLGTKTPPSEKTLGQALFKGSSSQGQVAQVLAGTDVGPGVRGHVGVLGGGFCCSVAQYGWGQGESRGTHTHTHTGTHTHTQERTRECCTYPLSL